MIVDIILVCLITIIAIIVIVEKICKKYKDSLNKVFYNLQNQIDDIWKLFSNQQSQLTKHEHQINEIKEDVDEIKKDIKKGGR